MPTQNTPILILGAGTFGLSTAHHLAKAGYTSITLLEKGLTIPSPLSAANDLNKIVRAEYEDPFYTDLALAAIEAWSSDPLFAPHFRQVGYLLGNSAAAPEKSRISFVKALSSIETHPAFVGKITQISSREDVRRVAPGLDGEMEGWEGYFNALAGYARAADALRGMYEEVKGMGVDVRLGEAVASLEYEGGRCVGAVTEARKRYVAEVTVVTLGASVAKLLPALGKQLVARSWTIAHVQPTEEEAEKLKGIPVTYSRDLGFFMEPDRTGLLKVSPSGAGFTNYVDGVSLPTEQNGFLPAGEEEAVRKLLRVHLPSLADRPLVGCKICWCADTVDSEYIIDFVPGTEGLIVATGDSGHAFKMFPLVGGWIKDVLENGKQSIFRWKWKERSDADSGPADVSWRVGKSRDLSEVV